MDLRIMLKVLADETRWDLMNCLFEEDLCGRALAARLGSISESAVSQHIKKLRKVGLIKSEQKGYSTCHTVNVEQLKKLEGEVSRFVHKAISKRPRKCSNEQPDATTSMDDSEQCKQCLLVKTTDISEKRRFKRTKHRIVKSDSGL